MNDQNNSLPVGTTWNALPGEIETELHTILHYWEQHSVDLEGTGFVGRIDQDNHIDKLAPKGVVLNTRILWTFSAVYHHAQNPLHLELAERAFNYIREYFTDHEEGGLYWSVDHQGKMLDSHKQVYAQAFGIYAMSEYYRVSHDANALEHARELFLLIEKYSLDHEHGGYIDSFARDWTFQEDKRLSAKDENASKTMNTHLHLVEAYANLYEVWPSPAVKIRVVDLLKIFDEKIIQRSSHHLTLFFSEDWQPDESVISYGHDIEAAWLLLYCAESIQDADSINTAKKNALLITGAAMEGLADDGGLWYEYNIKKQELIQEKHWWPQAEALIGFCNAWQLTGNNLYKKALLKSWQFIRNQLIDKSNGEWFWGIDNDQKIMPGQDKVGMWKGPYHNGRCCLEILKRLKPKA
jgi:mannobiose 2-epimerase